MALGTGRCKQHLALLEGRTLHPQPFRSLSRSRAPENEKVDNNVLLSYYPLILSASNPEAGLGACYSLSSELLERFDGGSVACIRIY